MKTSIIGYPRVGALRELKFATEKYFRNEIAAEDLQSTAREQKNSFSADRLGTPEIHSRSVPFLIFSGGIK